MAGTGTRARRVSGIAALDDEYTIGAGNRLPWRIPEDSRRFRTLTMGHPVIMGRRTYESIGAALDGRLNVIVTRAANYVGPGCVIVSSIEAALRTAYDADDEEVFIAGGGEIYRQTIDLCDRLYLTLVRGRFGGETKFPDYTAFHRQIYRQPGHDGTHHYEFVVVEKGQETPHARQDHR